jgi:hypothetical protein
LNSSLGVGDGESIEGPVSIMLSNYTRREGEEREGRKKKRKKREVGREEGGY